jgi:hypothetical protein
MVVAIWTTVASTWLSRSVTPPQIVLNASNVFGGPLM